MANWRDTDKILHVYGQAIWHDDLTVVGNRAGLESLRAAIDKALRDKAGIAGAMQNDGEGYWITVAVAEAEELDRLPMAYEDELATGGVEPDPFPPGVEKKLHDLHAKDRVR